MNYKRKSSELLGLIPIFKTAVSNLAENGFFESCEVNIGGYQGVITSAVIQGAGYLPDSPMYMEKGCTPLVDPYAAAESLKEMLATSELLVTSFTCKTNTEDWAIYRGMDVRVGSKGFRISFELRVYFDTDSQHKKIAARLRAAKKIAEAENSKK